MCPHRKKNISYNEDPLERNEMDDKVKLAKTITKFVVGIGVYRITREIVSRNVAPRSQIDNLFVTSGSIAAGMMASEAAGNYTDSAIDSFVNSWNKNAKPDTTDSN
jgi:hypothetical protein